MSGRLQRVVAMASLWGLLMLGRPDSATAATNATAPSEVVVYTSVDQVVAEPVLKRFESESGIAVKAVYDAEAAKTTGLFNRLKAESARPRADVWWNSEIVRTLQLRKAGLLEAHVPPTASDIPARFKDPEGQWTGFAARLRVLIVNSRLVPEGGEPKGVHDLARPEWKDRVALPYPLFGTTATHAAAWFELWGPQKARTYLTDLKANGILITDGNAASRDRVVDGTAGVGFTDSDDVLAAMSRGQPVRMVIPDQEEGGMGTLAIPNTVALIKGGPHPVEGRRLVDFLIGPEVEAMLAASESANIPVRGSVAVPEGFPLPRLDSVRLMKVDWDRVAERMEESSAFCRDLFIR